MEILNFLSGIGLGALLTTIIDRVLDYKLSKRKFQFEKLYIKRAVVIEETYKKMIKTHRAIESLVCPLQLAGEPPKEEKMKSAAKIGNDFIEYFDINRIFFDENLELEIDQLNKKMQGAFTKFKYATMFEIGKQDIKEWIEAWDEIKERAPKLKGEIEKNFRRIIGIN